METKKRKIGLRRWKPGHRGILQLAAQIGKCDAEALVDFLGLPDQDPCTVKNILVDALSYYGSPKLKLTPFPEGWLPADSHDQRFQYFCDYARAHNKQYADWEAAWRNWKRSPYQKNGGMNGRRAGSVLDSADRLIDYLGGEEAGRGYIPGSSGPQPRKLDIPKGAHGIRQLPKG